MNSTIGKYHNIINFEVATRNQLRPYLFIRSTDIYEEILGSEKRLFKRVKKNWLKEEAFLK